MKKSFGFSLVEVIVAVSIATISILSVWKVYNFFIRISISNPSFFQASFLAEEGIEAIKFLRDSGWNSNITTLSAGLPYSLVFNGTNWATTTSVIYIDNKFDRRVILSDVYRDINGNIAETGSFDAGTKKVLVVVAWQKNNSTTTKEIITYVTNIFKN